MLPRTLRTFVGTTESTAPRSTFRSVGERPFRGRSYGELLQSIGNDPVTLGGEGVERRRLEAVLRCATANDPAMRYASVADLLGDLIPALDALPAEVGDPDASTGAAVATKTTLKR